MNIYVVCLTVFEIFALAVTVRLFDIEVKECQELNKEEKEKRNELRTRK